MTEEEVGSSEDIFDFNGQFVPAGKHGSCIQQTCTRFGNTEYNFHDSLQMCLKKGTGH